MEKIEIEQNKIEPNKNAVPNKVNFNKNVDPNKKEKDNELKLIPKATNYIQYMVELILKLPRTEKFNIGQEYKLSMYEMLRQIMYLNKIDLSERLPVLNRVDAELNAQRIFLRIMKNNKYIDNKKFDIVMAQIYELGKIIGGLCKYYAKNYKKPV